MKVLPINFLAHFIRPPDVSRESLKFYPWTFFYQSTVLSSHAEDDHQMYFGGSIVSKGLTIGIGISPTPPLIFTGSQVMRNLAWFSASLNFEPLAFENAAICPNSETKVAMPRWSSYVLAKYGEVGFTHHWESSVSSDPPAKIAREKAPNRR